MSTSSACISSVRWFEPAQHLTHHYAKSPEVWPVLTPDAPRLELTLLNVVIHGERMPVHTPNELYPYLKPTRLIDSGQPDIMAAAREITHGAQDPEAQASRIFYFIRDHIRYEFRGKFDESQYFASYVLSDAKGFCTQKAILFCALARACGIPAGIHFFDIIDHSLPPHVVALMQTNVLYHHGIGALYLNNRWVKYDATLHLTLTRRNHLKPVEFAPDRDCLMHAETLDGRRHIETIRDFGRYPDVSFQEVTGWFKAGYPHLARRYAHVTTS